MTATIFDIQRFSVHDGPGIRTTVFMKGCPLKCAWCHNPEGLQGSLQIQFTESECIYCGKCDKKAFERIHLCPTGALKICGETIDEEALFAKLVQDEVFYHYGGGITFSGGECLLQADFVANMLVRLKKKSFHTAIDTCGHIPLINLEKTRGLCDLYLYDIKLMDSISHLKWTGVDNKLIIDNLKTISTWGIPIWIRIPVIPDVNDNTIEMMKIAELISSIANIEQVTLMPYHTLGVSKYETLGLNCTYETNKKITQQALNEFQSIFTQKQIYVCGG